MSVHARRTAAQPIGSWSPHTIKETGLSSDTDAVLALVHQDQRRYASSNSTTAPCPRPASHVRSGTRALCRTPCLGRSPRHDRRHVPHLAAPPLHPSQTFPAVHIVLAGKDENLLDNRLKTLADDMKGITTIAARVNPCPGSSAASPGRTSASTTRTGAAGATPNRPAAAAEQAEGSYSDSSCGRALLLIASAMA
jgi:hypothetical protein